MQVVRERGLDTLLRERAGAGTPIFGSCLGMQLLFEHSEEHGGADGLGLLRGGVSALRADSLKLPHIGWSAVSWREGGAPLNAGLPEPSYLYHVHSFVVHPADEDVVLATAEYGETFPAIVGKGKIFGAQSHPEKSSTHGLRLLANFASMCAGSVLELGALLGVCVILYPAIDILGGSAVRLRKGDFAQSKVYDEDPLAAARAWVQEGAQQLHVVDLDGAREGAPANLEHVSRITRELGVRVQLGGGLRSPEAITRALEAGVARVILGTAAFTDPELLDEALAAHGPERVMVSVDARSGRVVTEGWTKSTDISVDDVLGELKRRGVRELLYTSVDRDGMLEGVDAQEARGGRARRRRARASSTPVASDRWRTCARSQRSMRLASEA